MRSLVLFGLLMLALPPAAARAHARLETSSPAAGERIDAPVSAVTLTFDGPVEASLSSIRIIDAAGADCRASAPVHPAERRDTLTVRTAPLRRGRFVVAWRAVSGDSHVVSGAFAFGVHEAAGEVPAALAQPPEPGLPIILAALHAASIASLLLAVGSMIASGAVPARRATLARVERPAWTVLAAIVFVQLAGQAEALAVAPLRLIETPFGTLRIALILGAAVGRLAPQARWAFRAAAAGAVVLAEVLSGHAATGASPALGVAVDAVHLVGAAAWTGALIAALGASKTADIGRISGLAAAGALALTLTALPQGLRNIAAAAALETTVYGRLVCVKAGLFAGTLAVAAVSHLRSRRAEPRIAASVKAEIALLGALTVVTGLLVDAAPPRTAATAPAASGLGSFAAGDRTIAVDATRTGPREYAVLIATTRGAEPADIEEVRASIEDREQRVGPLDVPLTRRGTGLYAGRASLPFRGRWRLSVRVRVGEFEAGRRSFPL